MELSLDFSSVFVPKPMSEFLLEVSKTQDLPLKLAKIDSYLEKLEEEKRKIDGFKRELPLSMLILSEVIGRLKEEAMICRESMSLKGKFDDERGAKQENDKKDWMSSARLWISNSPLKKIIQEHHASAIENQINGVAFPAFGAQSDHNQAVQSQIKSQTNLWSPLERKERRRWSPDLHRKFVEALENLGGHKVATPKQIREMMQVEGLTNDEVKSHLQKYRIHIRKASDQNPQRVLLRGSSSNEANSSESEVISDGKNWKFV